MVPPKAFPWGKVAFAKQMTDEGNGIGCHQAPIPTHPAGSLDRPGWWTEAFPSSAPFGGTFPQGKALAPRDRQLFTVPSSLFTGGGKAPALPHHQDLPVVGLL